MARSSSSPDVYTVLTAAAAACLLGAIIFVVVKSGNLFGGSPLDPSATGAHLIVDTTHA